jgi:hypothetical protein
MRERGLRGESAAHGFASHACGLTERVLSVMGIRPESWGSIRHTPIKPSIKVTALCRNFLSS